MREPRLLQQVADAFLAKYGSDWTFEVADDGTFRGPGVSLVYRLAPVQALGFGKGPFSHTRWDFSPDLCPQGPAATRRDLTDELRVADQSDRSAPVATGNCRSALVWSGELALLLTWK